jgi:ABC-type molybdenum transport system ATPase subunit/photorepair protein PhrA/uncharacterized ubiquitin-like protein YukD
MFSKANMEDIPKYDFLKQKLSDDFLIPDNNRSKVIFGYNGIGKTSIYRYIRDHKEDDRITFLDYIDERNDFIKNKKKLQVTADVLSINALNVDIENIKEAMSVSSNLGSNFGITSATKAREHGDIIKAAQKNEFAGFTQTRVQMKEICDSLGEIEPKILLNVSEVLDDVVNYTDEITEYKDHVVFNSLALLDQVVSSDDSVCPICDSDINNIKAKITEKMLLLNNRKSLIIESLKKNNLQPTEENFQKLVNTKRLLVSENVLAEWMICNGDIDRFDLLQEKQVELANKIAERDSLITAIERLYQNLKVSEGKIKRDISRYFSLNTEDIVFDDDEKKLTINLPREVKTYSTGEMNLLSFLIRIYEFIGSEKSILILDDPVSSLDIINHYKIVYEIVKAAEIGKTLVILTHSIEMINGLNSQYSRDFDYYYIDEDTEFLHIQEIPRRDNGKNLMTLEVLLDEDEHGVIAALIQKENSSSDNAIHKLFHYDGSFSMLEYPNISNDYFVEMIDNFVPLVNDSFLRNSYNKVIYIAALRVWVEKEIRDLIVSNPILLNEFTNECTLVKRISVLLKRDGTCTAPIPENLSRSALMSKKVMLNQGIHYQSQVMPFAYALNISLRELNQEIVEIKNFFN